MQLCIFTYDLNKFINCKIKICKIKFTFITKNCLLLI